jgi:hypothetical protein
MPVFPFVPSIQDLLFKSENVLVCGDLPCSLSIAVLKVRSACCASDNSSRSILVGDKQDNFGGARKPTRGSRDGAVEAGEKGGVQEVFPAQHRSLPNRAEAWPKYLRGRRPSIPPYGHQVASVQCPCSPDEPLRHQTRH